MKQSLKYVSGNTGGTGKVLSRTAENPAAVF